MAWTATVRSFSLAGGNFRSLHPTIAAGADYVPSPTSVFSGDRATWSLRIAQGTGNRCAIGRQKEKWNTRLTAGLLEESHNFDRLQRLSDMVLASVVN